MDIQNLSREVEAGFATTQDLALAAQMSQVVALNQSLHQDIAVLAKTYLAGQEPSAAHQAAMQAQLQDLKTQLLQTAPSSAGRSIGMASAPWAWASGT